MPIKTAITHHRATIVSNHNNNCNNPYFQFIAIYFPNIVIKLGSTTRKKKSSIFLIFPFLIFIKQNRFFNSNKIPYCIIDILMQLKLVFFVLVFHLLPERRLMHQLEKYCRFILSLYVENMKIEKCAFHLKINFY